MLRNRRAGTSTLPEPWRFLRFLAPLPDSHGRSPAIATFGLRENTRLNHDILTTTAAASDVPQRLQNLRPGGLISPHVPQTRSPWRGVRVGLAGATFGGWRFCGACGLSASGCLGATSVIVAAEVATVPDSASTRPASSALARPGSAGPAAARPPTPQPRRGPRPSSGPTRQRAVRRRHPAHADQEGGHRPQAADHHYLREDHRRPADADLEGLQLEDHRRPAE